MKFLMRLYFPVLVWYNDGMSALGIDLGNALIKVAKVEGKKIDFLAAFSNPLGKLTIETEKEMDTLAEALKKDLIDSKIEGKVYKMVIPDSLSYFRVISLPLLTDAELSSAIRWEAEQYVPVKLDDVELSWDVIERPKIKTAGEKMQVLLVAAVKSNVAKMVELLGRVGLEVESIEPELIASSRSLVYGRNYTDGTMLCCMGAGGMSIALFNGEKLVFVYRFGSGGTAMTRSISTTLQLTMAQAEEYKRAYGVMTSVLEGKLLMAMAPVIDGMVSEMKKAMSFFTQNLPSVRLSRVILSGGVALMPGWVQYLTNKLGMEVSVGDPLSGMEVASEKFKVNTAIYSSVIGLLKE